MGELKLRERKEPIRTHIFIPASVRQKERYDRLKLELDRRKYESLHSMARMELDLLLGKVEELLGLTPL